MNVRFFYSSVFCQHFAYGIIIPTLIVWQYKIGLSYGEIGIVQAAGLLATLTCELPSSYFADRVGKKLALLLGFILSILSFYFLISAVSLVEFLIVQIFFGLGVAFFSGTQESLLHDLVGYENKMNKFLAKMSVVDEVSTIAGMMTSSILITIYSIETSFMAGLISLIFGFICILFLKIVAEENSHNNHNFSPLKIRSAAFLIVFFFFAAMSLRGEIIFQSSFVLTETALMSLGMIYILGKIFSILGSISGHKIEYRLGVLNSMFFSLILQAGSFLLILSGGKLTVVISLAIYLFAENVFRNIRDAWILKGAPKNRRSTFMSIASFSSAILAVMLNPVMGFSIDRSLYLGIMIIVGVKIIGGVVILRKNVKKAFL